MIMAVGGNCITVPDIIDSVGECKGEFIGVEPQDSEYASLTVGLCKDPIF
jgi:hypothetical protein